MISALSVVEKTPFAVVVALNISVYSVLSVAKIVAGAKLTLYTIDRKRQAHRDKYFQIEQKVRAAIRSGSKVIDSPKAEKDTMGL